MMLSLQQTKQRNGWQTHTDRHRFWPVILSAHSAELKIILYTVQQIPQKILITHILQQWPIKMASVKHILN